MSKKDWGKAGVAALACYATAAIGAIASVSAKDYYSKLEQPSWAPPGSVFGPVWTTLFTLMAVSVWLVWRKGKTSELRLELGLFAVQLAVNGLWSWLFFRWNLGLLAFLDILLLIVLVSSTVVVFWRRSKVAAALLIPYLAWISFAAFLCFTVWQLNPDALG